ncbi:MAG: (2Fe-2S)-binding protein, partial [Hyphomicrobiales bacterium]
TTPRANYRRAAPLLARAMLSGNEIRKGLAWRRDLKKRAALFRSGVDGVRIEGGDAVEDISFHAGGRSERLACDMVLLHEGVVPNTQLAMAAGAGHDYDPLQACWRPQVDGYGRTSETGILVAGDGAGIGGAELAAEAGRLAALAAAADLSRLSPEEAARQATAARAKIDRKASLRRFLDTLYRPRDEVLAPPDDETMVCRCEEVTAGDLRQVAAMGCLGPNQAKAFTRCGMGPCQGRMCGLASAAILAQATGQSVAETGHLRIRAPIKPITVGELAALEGVGAPPDMGPLLPTAPDDGDEA